jgi:hypothetical protein
MDERTPLSLLRSVREELLAVQRKVDYLVAVLDSQRTGALDGITGSPIPPRPLDIDLVNQALLEMRGKESQEGILDVLLQSAGKCADRVILFDAENGKLQAWKGLGIPSEKLSSIVATETENPLVEAIRTGQPVPETAHPEKALPWLKLLGSLPDSCLCIPLAFGSYVPLVLYADSTSKLDSGSLQLLVRLAVLHMQNQYLAHLLQMTEEGRETEQEEGQIEPDKESESEFHREAELVEEDNSQSLTEEEEEAAHGEARRLARLLVAEIKLYNEEEVEEGREQSDLYRRLRTDIDRSRKMYEKLVHPMIQAQTDYYGAEVVRVLAKDDPDLMGEGYGSADVSNPIDQSSD